MSDANFFASLQMISMSSNNPIIEDRKKMNRIVEAFKSREEYVQELTWFATKTRYLEPKTFLDVNSFMVQPFITPTLLDEELRHDSLGFCRGGYMIYSGRYVYPVHDSKGDVMGWCGYDKFEDPKYLDSINNGYKAKVATFYGMEKIEEYYKSDKPILVPEGIMCCLYARQCGSQSLAMLGSYLSPYMIAILRRFGKRVVMLCDSDEAGNKCRKSASYALPEARIYQSCIAKDLDDSRLKDNNIREELKKFESFFYTGNYFR